MNKYHFGPSATAIRLGKCTRRRINSKWLNGIVQSNNIYMVKILPFDIKLYEIIGNIYFVPKCFFFGIFYFYESKREFSVPWIFFLIFFGCTVDLCCYMHILTYVVLYEHFIDFLHTLRLQSSVLR